MHMNAYAHTYMHLYIQTYRGLHYSKWQCSTYYV